MKLEKGKNFFKILIVLLFAFTFFACSDAPKTVKLVVDPPIEDPGGEDPPEEPEVTMKAVFLYDGSLKAFNDDKSLSVIGDAESVVKIGNQWIIGNELRNKPDGSAVETFDFNVIAACNYGGVMWLYSDENKLYRDGVYIGQNTGNYTVALNSDGVAIGFTFYKPDGSFILADNDFGFQVGNKIVGIAKVGDNRIKKVFVNGEWEEISQSTYTGFFKYDALILEDKVIWTMGATLDLIAMTAIEPTYNTALQSFVGGNAFTRHFIKFTEQRWQPVGYIGNTAYFFRPKNGKIYKYDIAADSLTEWVQIVDGTLSDEIYDNNALIELTGAILVDVEIIYFDGAKIQRLDLGTGEKIEIADATEFQGIAI